MPKEEINQKSIQEVSYETIGRRGFFQKMIDSFPEEAIPTKRTPKILGIIFLIVVILGVAQFPFGGIMSGNTNISIKIGIPLTFLDFKLYSPEENPLRFWNVILDIIIYLIVAYLIDISINYFKGIRFTKTEEEKKKIPTMYKTKKDLEQEKNKANTLAEKVTDKIFTN